MMHKMNPSSQAQRCQDLPWHFSRKEFLHVGMIGGLGLTLPQFLQMKANAAQKHYESVEGKAKSVIHIYLPGGMAHQESFDPKPYAPLEYRGPMGSIATKIPVPVLANFSKKLQKLRTRSLSSAR
jgi:hypothetical protein